MLVAKTTPPSFLATGRPAKDSAPRWKVFLAGVLIVLAGLAAYSNSFHGPFIIDDEASIRDNSTIQQGWLDALSPPVNGATVMGRPLVNLSLALNYHTGGFSPVGYHAVNLAIHLLAGLVLFGLVRRTLELPGHPSDGSLGVALSAALLWTVHPLQTESVTYIDQRAESLMGLFFLLTLYCFVRGTQSARPGRWRVQAVVACLLSTLCKEVAVAIPVIVLLYDRTFLAGTFAEAWRRRGSWHLALAYTWIPLGMNVWATGTRGETAGFGMGMGWWAYALMQIRAIIVYLELSVWPHPLVLSYGTAYASQAGLFLPSALVLAALVSITVYALWRSPKLGFLGAWFFIILAPSSSVVPVITEPMAEHRMYLPLAALVVLAAVTLFTWAGRRAPALVAVLAFAWGLLAFQRNHQYKSLTEISKSDVAALPANSSLHNNLAKGLISEGRVNESIQEFKLALALDPGNGKRENALGLALALNGQTAEALPHYLRAVELKPDDVVARVNLGNLLKESGRLPEAVVEYLKALHDKPDSAEVRTSLGSAYNAMGQTEKALPYYQSAVALKPDLEQAHMGLGNTRALLGQWDDAAKEYDIALKLDPQDYYAHYSLGEVLVNSGKAAAARREFMEVLREQPDFAPARNALAALPPAETDPASPSK